MSNLLTTYIRRNHASWKGWLRLLMTDVDFLLGPAQKFTEPDLATTRRLVFVCLGNLNRSAFAEAVCHGLGLKCASFGLFAIADDPAGTRARQVAAEFGYSLEQHRATDRTDFEPMEGDLYLVMETRHARFLIEHGTPAERIALLGYWARPQRLHLHDPQKYGLSYFRTCFTLIHSAVLNLGREWKASRLAEAHHHTHPHAAPPAAPKHSETTPS